MQSSAAKKKLRRLTERLQTLETSLRDLQKGLALCIDMDRSTMARRSLAVFFGMPLACVAFVFLTFLVDNFNGNGLYIGMGSAFLCWLMARGVLVPYDSPLAELEAQVERLIRSRERTKALLKDALDDVSPETKPADDFVDVESEAA